MRFAGSGLSLSVFGLPVAGSIGWSSQINVAHSLLPPQVERWTLVPPSSESQFPSGFAASAALVKKQNAIAVLLNIFILNSDCGQVRPRKTHIKRDRTKATSFGG